MAEHICPWWLGYILAGRWRRLWQDPHVILSPFVRPGMTVLEPGPGMGYFTLELARLVGAEGKVIALDVQPKMLSALAHRAQKAGVSDWIALRQPKAESMHLQDLSGQVDFVLAFAVVHEFPDAAIFFREAASAMKPGGRLLLAEPSGHVNREAWNRTLAAAAAAGLREEKALAISHSHAVLLQKA